MNFCYHDTDIYNLKNHILKIIFEDLFEIDPKIGIQSYECIIFMHRLDNLKVLWDTLIINYHDFERETILCIK